MEQQEIRAMLEQVAKGEMNVDDAMLQLKRRPMRIWALPKSTPIVPCARVPRR